MNSVFLCVSKVQVLTCASCPLVLRLCHPPFGVLFRYAMNSARYNTSEVSRCTRT